MCVREKLREIIFGTETPAGRAFDVVLLWTIVISVITVVLGSVSSLRLQYDAAFRAVEWTVTALFTLEYILRLSCSINPRGYARSFFGVVDLLSILPTYIGLFLGGVQSLVVIRALRLLRIFRVLKLGRFVKQSEYLLAAFRSSRDKIMIFLMVVLTSVLILGTAMYLIEGEANGFSSIPQSMYWAVVTMTTVGYGDVAPQTVLGKALASLMMLIGYAIIAVPTGIITVEAAQAMKNKKAASVCPQCQASGHQEDAQFCRVCATHLPLPTS